MDGIAKKIETEVEKVGMEAVKEAAGLKERIGAMSARPQALASTSAASALAPAASISAASTAPQPAEIKLPGLSTEQLLKYSSLGAAMLFFIIGAATAYFIPTVGMAFLIFAVFVGLVPWSTWQYIQYSKYKKMELFFPNFMRDLAEAKKSGMTFPQAFEFVSKADYGPLSPEVKRAVNQMSWGLPFPEVITRLGHRIRGSKIMRQAFTIIIEAFNAGGDVAETMDSIAMDIGMIRDVDDERKTILSQQIFVMYFIFYLFLGIIVALYKLLIPMLSITGTTAAVGAGVGGLGLAGIFGATNYCLNPMAGWLCTAGQAFGFQAADPMTYFKSLFLFMCLIQAAGCGIIGGKIGEDSMIAGFKHIAIMAVSTIVVFVLFMG